jgi:two-component system chemotaxis sensor kinase CheA
MSSDPYKYFRVEAHELLGQLGEGALALEKPGANAELVGRLLRQAHTLKGAARVVKQVGIANAAHAFEEVLAAHRELREPWSTGQADRLLEQLDAMTALFEQIDPPAAGVTGPALPQERARTLRTDVAELDSVLDGLAEALAELTALRTTLDGDLDQVRKLAELCLRQLVAARPQETRQADRTLDRTKSLTEELLSLVRRFDSRAVPGVDRAVRELAQVRGTVERLRLVPAHVMFTALERAVRDAGQELDKAVQFAAVGGDMRLDAHVLEVVQSALFHVVRNSVAHGIERAAVRRANGKPAHGLVRLEVVRRGRRVAFLCHDDGQGLDAVAVRGAMARHGMRSANANANPHELQDAELLKLLVHSGISTATRVTGVSGRGVGLDVLREAAQQLGGELELKSEPGRGFTVELVVPVSAAALLGLVVESGGTTATLPLEAVVECLRLRANEISQTPDGESVLHEGNVIPFVALSRALRTRATPERPSARSVVIVRGGTGQRMAVGVDRVLGTRMVMLRRLPPLASATAVVAGASVNAAGKPELVLDPDGLLAEAATLSVTRPTARVASKRVLVIDDSITTRMLEQSILESAGYEVDMAASGEEGLSKARSGAYGLMLVDVEMPGIDGFTFIEQARADPALQSIPAVLVSSRSHPDDLRRGQAVGAAGYIDKGRFDQRELLTLIRRLMAP